MANHYAGLTDAQQLLVWVGLISIALGVVSTFGHAIYKDKRLTGPDMAFQVSFLIMFGRILFRLLGGGPLGYGSVVIYALPGISCFCDIVASDRARRKAKTG